MALLLVVSCSLLIRCAHFIGAYHSTTDKWDKTSQPWLFLSQDSAEYVRIPLSLLKHGEYNYIGDPAGNTTAAFRRTPGYPMLVTSLCILFGLDVKDGADELRIDNPTLLKIFVDYHSLVVVLVLLNHLLGISTGVLLFFVVAWKTTSLRTALCVGLVFAVFPSKVYVDNFVGPYSLFGLLFLCSSVAFLIGMERGGEGSSRWLTLAAIQLGISALVLPASYLIWPVFCSALLFFHPGQFKRRLCDSLLFMILACSIPGLWTIRNGLVTEVYSYNTLSNFAIFHIKAQDAVREKEGLSYAGFYANELHYALEEKVVKKIDRDRPSNQAEADYIYEAVGWDIIAENLSWSVQAHLKSVVKELLISRYPPTEHLTGSHKIIGQVHQSLKWFELCLVIGTLGLALYGVYVLVAMREFGILFFLVGTVGYFVMATAGSPPGHPRYKLSWLPLVLILSSIGMAHLCERRFRYFHSFYG